jgi:hypothetical protein
VQGYKAAWEARDDVQALPALAALDADAGMVFQKPKHRITVDEALRGVRRGRPSGGVALTVALIRRTLGLV